MPEITQAAGSQLKLELTVFVSTNGSQLMYLPLVNATNIKP